MKISCLSKTNVSDMPVYKHLNVATMFSYKVFFLVCIFSKPHVKYFPLPILRESGCLTKLVFGNDTSEELPAFPSSINVIDTYTIHHVTRLNFVIEIEDILEKNFTIKDGYFQLARKFQTCITVVLLTNTFEETILGIHNSGFSSSDDVLFLIKVDEIHQNDSIIWSFTNELFAADIAPFHAPLAFFTLSNHSIVVGLHCYFCDEKFLPAENLSLTTLRNKIERLNSWGYGRKLKLLTPPILQLGVPHQCLLSVDQLKLRQLLYTLLKNCFEELHVVISTLQPYANITLTPDIKYTDSTRWFLKATLGEMGTFMFPNHIAFTRGSHWVLGETPIHMISCIHIHSLKAFDFAFSEIFPPTILVGMLLVIIPHIWIYQDFSRSVDVVWPFLGMHYLLHKHPRKVVGFTLLVTSVFWYVYDAYICADCIYIAEFPSFAELMRQGYKLWIPKADMKQEFVGLLRAPKMQELLKPFFRLMGTMTLEEFVVHRSENTVQLEDVVHLMASTKLLVYALYRRDLFYGLGKSDKFMQKKYKCHVFDLLVDIPLQMSVPRSGRIRGYMSNRMTWLLTKTLEMGIFEFAKSFKYTQSQSQVTALQMTKASALAEPIKASILQSPIGISAMYLIGINFIVLVSFLMKYWKKWNLWSNWLNNMCSWFALEQRMLIAIWNLTHCLRSIKHRVIIIN